MKKERFTNQNKNIERYIEGYLKLKRMELLFNLVNRNGMRKYSTNDG